jgi:two-component system chemotaxis sensor kinase CheA
MDDLLRDFLTETNENIDVADTQLIKFEQDPSNAEILNNIFRLVHTIKGTCGFIGLTRLASLAHAAETLMDRFREGMPVTSDAVGLVLRTIDRIKEILAALEASEGIEPTGSDEDLTSQLIAMAAGEAQPAKAAKAVEAKPAKPAKPAAAAKPVEPPAPVQSLERPLLPGEVSLDELERMFRDTPVEPPKPFEPLKAANAPAPVEAPKPVPAKAAEKAPAPAIGAAAANDDGAAQGSVSSQTIRVNVDALEHLMTTISELVLTRNQLLEISRRSEDDEYKVSLQRLSTVTAELQSAVMQTRMQPVGNAWQKLPRLVRDLSNDLGKYIDLELTGAETELDRQVLDFIKDPLIHMVRNSADHGLESPSERIKAGKSERGVIKLAAYHQGGQIVIEVGDNGRGLDVDRIRAKAIDNGLATEAEVSKMSDSQVFRFIFQPGFSTAAKVTSVSGRGVGMDVVRSNIEQIGGTVDVRSKLGAGSTFTIKIPLTLAILPALIVSVHEQRFAIPQLAVVELVRAQAGSEHVIEQLKGAPVMRLRETLLPIVRLADLLGTADAGGGSTPEADFVVVMRVGGQVFGLVVDKVCQTEEIVVKPMSSKLRGVAIFSGCTILGDGRVIMIIDPNGVAQAATFATEATAQEGRDVPDAEKVDAALVSMLIVRAGSHEPKAVPLSLITRLEEVEATSVELANGRQVVQYRGDLIPLVYASDDMPKKTEGTLLVLVFTEGERSMGLVVDEIVDIVADRLDIQLPSDVPGAFGAAIINGAATAVLDVGHFLAAGFKDWFDRAPANRTTARLKVVLVDDSDFYRSLVEPMLRAAGCDVTGFRSPQDALGYLTSGGPCDAIVSDIDMPVMDGFAFTTILRQDVRFTQTPIIAVSGVCTPEAVERGRAAGFTDYVGKFDRAGLVTALAEISASFSSPSHITDEAA